MKSLKLSDKIKSELVNSNGLPRPRKVNCFQCKKDFEVKYVIPNKCYSKKNNWEYWTNPEAKSDEFWKDKETRKKDKQICNSCLLKFYYDKETYWETITDLKKRSKLRTYIYEGKFAV